MQVRFLKPGEESLWYEFIDEMSGERFTQAPDYRPETHIVCEEANKIVGGMELIIDEPDMVILYNPLAQTNAPAEILDVLIKKGLEVAQPLNCHRLLGLIQDNDQREVADRSFYKADFRFAMEKALYTIRPGSPISNRADFPLTFKSLKEIGERGFVNFLAMVYEPDVFDSEPDECFFALKRRAIASRRFYPEDWLVAYLDKREVGIIMPQLHDEKGTGSNFYLGVLSDVRRKGIGKILQAKSIAILINREVKLILGSCDIKNIGMVKIFEALHYKFEAYQYFYQFMVKDNK